MYQALWNGLDPALALCHVEVPLPLVVVLQRAKEERYRVPLDDNAD